MRILVLPDCIYPLGKENHFNMVWKWARWVHLNHPEKFFFEYVVPQDGPPWGTCDLSRFQGMDRMRVHRVPMISSGWINHVADGTEDLAQVLMGQTEVVNGMWSTRELWNKFRLTHTDVYYDAVLCGRMLFTPVLKRLLKPPSIRSRFYVPFFNAVSGTDGTDRWIQQATGLYGEEGALGELFSYMQDYAILLSPAERRRTLAEARKWLSATAIRRLEQSLFVAPFGGVDTDKIEPVYQRRKKGGRPDVLRVLYGGRWQETGKGCTKMLEIVDALVRRGRKLAMVVCSPVKMEQTVLDQIKKRFPYVEIHTGLAQDKFFEQLENCHLFVCCSDYESFGYAWGEKLYAGLLGVVLDADVRETLCPPEYPYVARTQTEFVSKLDDLVRDYEGAVARWTPVFRENIQKRFALSSASRMIADWIKLKTGEFYSKNIKVTDGEDSMGGLVKKALAGMDGPLPIEEIYKLMTKATKSGNFQFGAGSLITRGYLRRLIMACGWEDTCEGVNPVMVRRK